MNRDEWASTHQHFESDWWGDCANTYGEESKQVAYARAMDMPLGEWRGGDKWPTFDFRHAAIIDVGGGPASMLLKTDFAMGLVVDPCRYPDWTYARYAAHGVDAQTLPAEDYLVTSADRSWDEAWCYNVLQHVIDPEKIVREMRRVARTVRLFEWVDQPAYTGHPHELHTSDLRRWLDVKTWEEPSLRGRELWLDEQYREIGPESDSPVRQHAFAGCFS